jgi:hypothetical protein
MRRASRPRGALAAAAALLLACVLAPGALLPGASAALLAVDYGSEWVKAALVAPGRAPISIVLNEASKRKSLAAVSFSAGERALGDDAGALAARYPERVYLRARDLLGRPAAGAALGAALAARYSPHAPAGSAVAGRGTVALPAHGSAKAAEAAFTAEELAASVLHYARQCAEAQAGSPIRDAVVTVPAYWSQAQRTALADAAALAGLNLLSLVSEHAAAAVQYGIDREPPAGNETELVVLYDVGAGKTLGALVEYGAWRAKEAGKLKTYGSFEVKALAWDEGAGGEALDAALAGAWRAGRACRACVRVARDRGREPKGRRAGAKKREGVFCFCAERSAARPRWGRVRPIPRPPAAPRRACARIARTAARCRARRARSGARHRCTATRAAPTTRNPDSRALPTRLRRDTSPLSF